MLRKFISALIDAGFVPYPDPPSVYLILALQGYKVKPLIHKPSYPTPNWVTHKQRYVNDDGVIITIKTHDALKGYRPFEYTITKDGYVSNWYDVYTSKPETLTEAINYIKEEYLTKYRDSKIKLILE